MPQELTQIQTERQIQVNAALQVALAHMVELPLVDLRERVAEEMMDNAALEEKVNEEDNVQEHQDETGDYDNTDEAYSGESEATSDELSDYFSEDDIPTYLLNRRDSEREQHESPITYGRSFYEEVSEQVGEQNLSDHERELMQYLVGSLDSDGLLRKSLSRIADELAVYHDTDTTEEELERLLKVLQTFEPRGIGARSLQECLLLQVDSLPADTPYKQLAHRALTSYFKEFTSKNWRLLQQKLRISDPEFSGLIHLLTHLNPAPGSAYNEESSSTAPTVIPDFYIQVDEEFGRVRAYLNNDGVPDLRVSNAFRDTVRQYIGKGKSLTREQSDAYVYAKQKVDAANNFLNLLRRRNSTLIAVMQTIADYQADFFLHGEDETMLKPMALKDIAPKAGVDISTVSRVAASKYVQTEYSTYPLKFFFSNEMTGKDGESISSRKIKIALRNIIDNEDKRHPYSDEALAKILNSQGFNIARRTVAKYRDQMGLPTGRLRR